MKGKFNMIAIYVLCALAIGLLFTLAGNKDSYMMNKVRYENSGQELNKMTSVDIGDLPVITIDKVSYPDLMQIKSDNSKDSIGNTITTYRDFVNTFILTCDKNGKLLKLTHRTKNKSESYYKTN